MRGIDLLVSEGLILFFLLLEWLGMVTVAEREQRAGVETFGFYAGVLRAPSFACVLHPSLACENPRL